MTALLYFAYGSNMPSSEIGRRCAGAMFAGVGRLADHRLAFTRYATGRKSMVADAIPCSGEHVWGVLYAVSLADRDALDKCEGYPRAYDRKGYRVTVDGVDRDVFAYYVRTPIAERPPCRSYWQLLVDGARERGLPPDYVAMLEGIPCVADEDQNGTSSASG